MLLKLDDAKTEKSHQAHQQVAEKLNEVKAKIKALQVMENNLGHLLQFFDGSTPINACPIMTCLKNPGV